MSISELFETGESKKNKGHFRNLVMIARVDGNISNEENELLLKIGKKIGLTDSQINEVKENPSKYPINPPVLKEERYERLLSLIDMVMIDGKVENSEINLLYKCSIGLGFTKTQFNEITPKIFTLIKEGKNKREILDSLL